MYFKERSFFRKACLPIQERDVYAFKPSVCSVPISIRKGAGFRLPRAVFHDALWRHAPSHFLPTSAGQVDNALRAAHSVAPSLSTIFDICHLPSDPIITWRCCNYHETRALIIDNNHQRHTVKSQ